MKKNNNMKASGPNKGDIIRCHNCGRLFYWSRTKRASESKIDLRCDECREGVFIPCGDKGMEPRKDKQHSMDEAVRNIVGCGFVPANEYIRQIGLAVMNDGLERIPEPTPLHGKAEAFYNASITAATMTFMLDKGFFKKAPAIDRASKLVGYILAVMEEFARIVNKKGKCGASIFDDNLWKILLGDAWDGFASSVLVPVFLDEGEDAGPSIREYLELAGPVGTDKFKNQLKNDLFLVFSSLSAHIGTFRLIAGALSYKGDCKRALYPSDIAWIRKHILEREEEATKTR